METTDGLGKEAQVWVDGQLLTVCDNVSATDRRCPPGALGNVRFSYVTNEAFSWREAIGGNIQHRKRLEPLRGWSYVGYGRVVSIMPVVIDFGLLSMEDANWTNDNGLVGQFVRITIDRLDISPAAGPDWPEQMR